MGNPSDLGPRSALGELPYAEVIEAILNDENVDCIFCVLYGGGLPADFYLQILNNIKNPEGKPMTFWVYGPRSEGIDQICLELGNNGYPVYRDMETAIKALGAMYQYAKIKKRISDLIIVSPQLCISPNIFYIYRELQSL